MEQERVHACVMDYDESNARAKDKLISATDMTTQKKASAVREHEMSEHSLITARPHARQPAHPFINLTREQDTRNA